MFSCYIYILIRCKTRNRQTHPDRFKPGRWQTKRPDLSSCTPWATTHRTKSRAHNNRHAIANNPGNLHAMSNHTQNDTQGAHPRTLQGERWARPRPVWYASRPELCASVPQPGTLARQGVRQNISTSFALPPPHQRATVRRLPFLVRGLLKITIRSNR